MKHHSCIFSISLILAISITDAHAGRCGPFDIFEGNDYCVSCGDGTEQVYQCPGGEVGMVAVGVAHPGCGVSYYSPSCRDGMRSITSSMKSKLEKEHNSVKKGHPSLTKRGDEVIIRMKQEDFDNFMQKSDATSSK